MKDLIILILVFAGLFACSCSTPPDTRHVNDAQATVQMADMQVQAPVLFAQDAVSALPAPDTPLTLGDFLKKYAIELGVAFMAFIKVIVNLTPTDKDNKIFGLLDTFINWIVPNFKSGGGTHT